MNAAEGILCDTCIAALNGETEIQEWKDYFGEIGYFPFDRYHHKTHRDFVSSKDHGCFICNWLWAKVPLPPETEDETTGQSATIDGFRIYCKIHGTVRLHVVCPWAADVELEVSMTKKENLSSRYAYGHPGSSPPLAWAELDEEPWSVLDDNIGSSQSLQKVKQWISSCLAGHKYCLPPDSNRGGYFPTRVIDVDIAEMGIVHLRNRSEAKVQHERDGECQGSQKRGTHPAYWTLSHRWGDPKLIPQLLQATEQQFRDGIPIDNLSPTFRDAVLLVHRLGYRYIWIDSLCIFQDSLSEWQQEAKAMVNVYRHSLCNISAISASSDPGRSRLFVKRRLQSRLLFPFKFNGKLRGSSGGAINDGPWIFWNGSLWADEIESTPLSTRGWVVQERFLTPRVLHFTENQIYWECLENECCEADPTGKFLILAHASGSPKIVPTVYKKARLELAKKRTDLAEGRSTDDTNVQFHTQWGDVVSLYANCALTKESDRLIAMSGIAKTFQEANNDKYLAGLWKKVIYTNLTWTTNASDGAKVHRSKSYAPTWSWASVTGGHKRLSMLHQRYSRLPNPLIKLVEERIVTEPPGGDPTGLLRSAELDIECLLYYYRWTADSSKLTVYTDEARTQCYFEKEKKPKDLHLDTTGLVQKFAEADEMEGVCVPLCGAYGGYGGGTNVYLMLEHDSGTRFKRIGVFEEGEIGKWISEWSGQGTRITLV